MDLKIVITSNDPTIRQHYESFIEKNADRQDSGLDIPMPVSAIVAANEKGLLLNLGIRVAAYRNGRRVPYCLYARSSLATKTPLRLANSVGIIDSGYNGELKAVVDNISQDDYAYEPYSRLFQITSPDLEPHASIEIVDSIEDTSRGVGGFGSTGSTLAGGRATAA